MQNNDFKLKPIQTNSILETPKTSFKKKRRHSLSSVDKKSLQEFIHTKNNKSTIDNDIKIDIPSTDDNKDSFEEKSMDDIFSNIIRSKYNHSDFDVEWNKDLENEIIKISNYCKKESSHSFQKGKSYINYGKYIQILIIILGACSVYIGASSAPLEVKDPINIVLGATTSIVSSIYSMFSFSKKGNLFKDVSFGLDNLSRTLRCELFKPKRTRQPVMEFIMFAQVSRDKLLKKIENEL